MVFTAKTLPLLLLSACARCGQEGDAVPEDSSTVFPDEDGDGYSPFKGDCDDTNPTVHPDAPDPVGDDLDANCDGLDGVAERLSEASSVIMEGQSKYVGLGMALTAVGDATGDGIVDLLLVANQAIDETNLNISHQPEGYVFLLPGPLGPTSTLADAVTWVVEPTENAFSLDHVEMGGDLDGDGLSDLAFAQKNYSGSNASSGRVWIVYSTNLEGGQASEITDYIDSDVLGDKIGAALDARGDLDGDGQQDLLVGVPQTGGGDKAGLAVVFHGPLRGVLQPGDAQLSLHGTEVLDAAGSSASWAGDVNGDGYDDLLVGAVGVSQSPNDKGTAWLVYGPRAGELLLAEADATLYGELDGARTGECMSDAGDTNDDGYDDILIGAAVANTEGTRSGRAWLALGPLEGTLPISSAEATFTSAGELDWTGCAVEGAGDINQDGYDDVLISAPQQPEFVTLRAARISLFYGPLFGVYNPDEADRVWASEVYGDSAGITLSVDGDLTGDQVPDLVVGAPYTYSGEDRTGRVYILGLEP